MLYTSLSSIFLFSLLLLLDWRTVVNGDFVINIDVVTRGGFWKNEGSGKEEELNQYYL